MIRNPLPAVPLLVLLLACLAVPVRAADRLTVVTTFTVIADMARNVAGDLAEVRSITRPGAGIHGYEPTPRDIVGAQDADLILWNGLNLEVWFEQFFSNLRDVPAVVLSDGIEPIMLDGMGGAIPNPHGWMSVANAPTYVDAIAAALAERDPDNAETYKANAERYKAELASELEPYLARLATLPSDRRWLVTCEGAFSYLARDLGLREVYIWPVNADQNGTPSQVRKVIDVVRANEVPAVFCESTVNADPARQIARETGAAFGGVLYVDSLSEPDGAVPSYKALLATTIATIADALAPKP